MNVTGSTALAMENAALRAEVERLGKDYQSARDAHDMLLADNERLKAENEALLAANRDVMLHWDVLKADYDRLRAEYLDDWDGYVDAQNARITLEK